MKKASVHWSGARKESGRGPGDKLVINRSSTACRVPRSGLHGLHKIYCACASEEKSRTAIFGGLQVQMEGTPLGAPLRPISVALHPALPSPAAPARRAPPRPWYVWFLDSTGDAFPSSAW